MLCMKWDNSFELGLSDTLGKLGYGFGMPWMILIIIALLDMIGTQFRHTSPAYRHILGHIRRMHDMYLDVFNGIVSIVVLIC